jgi:hypothetical protein
MSSPMRTRSPANDGNSGELAISPTCGADRRNVGWGRFGAVVWFFSPGWLALWVTTAHPVMGKGRAPKDLLGGHQLLRRHTAKQSVRHSR